VCFPLLRLSKQIPTKPLVLDNRIDKRIFSRELWISFSFPFLKVFFFAQITPPSWFCNEQERPVLPPFFSPKKFSMGVGFIDPSLEHENLPIGSLRGFFMTDINHYWRVFSPSHLTWGLPRFSWIQPGPVRISIAQSSPFSASRG